MSAQTESGTISNRSIDPSTEIIYTMDGKQPEHQGSADDQQKQFLHDVLWILLHGVCLLLAFVLVGDNALQMLTAVITGYYLMPRLWWLIYWLIEAEDEEEEDKDKTEADAAPISTAVDAAEV